MELRAAQVSDNIRLSVGYTPTLRLECKRVLACKKHEEPFVRVVDEQLFLTKWNNYSENVLLLANIDWEIKE